MRIRNLYFNPHNELVTDGASAPLFARENMKVTFVQGGVKVLTKSPGASHIAFGGRGGKKIRLGLEQGKTYTAALKVHIDKVISGDMLPKALRFSFGCIDMDGNKTESFSDAAPNDIGVWEIHYTFKVPHNIQGAWVTFCIGTQSPDDTVMVSDIRITETDGKTAPFGIEGTIRTPYKDTADENQCVRDYTDSIELSYAEYIDYLEYAREYGYEFDIAQAKKAASHDDVFRTLTALFADDNAENADDIKAAFKSVDDGTKIRIAEKLVLLKNYQLLDELIPFDAPVGDDVISGLIHVDRLANRGDALGARDFFNENVNKDNSLQLFSHKVSQKQIRVIIGSFSRNLALRRYGTLKWMMKNINEITARAKKLSSPEFVPPENRPVWVYWKQGIENAPEVVKMCVAKMRSIFGDRLHVLSDNNVKYYVSSYYTDNITRIAHCSDHIRTELLYRYGGTWIDSTVLIKEKFRKMVDENDFILPSYSKKEPVIGNWLLSVSTRKTWFWSLMYAALTMYLSEYGDFNEYFMFHVIFRILTMIDKNTGKYWEDSLLVDASKAITYSQPKQLAEIVNDEEFRNRFNGSPVLKLTYKYDTEQVRLNSNIARIIRGDI